MRTTTATPALLTLLLAACLSPALHAQDDRQGSDPQARNYDPTYSAIRLTAMESDFDNIDTAINLGFTLGINIPGVDFLAAEIDISSTLVPGENSGGGGAFGKGLIELPPGLGGGDGGDGGGGEPNNTSDPDDLRANAVGIFATARSPGRFFGSARLGYRFYETTLEELNDESTGGAFGAGLGYRYNDLGGKVELTYTQYSDDLQFISLAVSY